MRNRFILPLALLFSVALVSGDLLAQAPAATPEENPTGNTGALKSQIETAGSYDPNSGNATRIVNDLHVPGALGAYGLDFTRYWNSLHNDYEDGNGEWPLDFGMSGWSHSWHWKAELVTSSDPIGGDNGEEIFNTSIVITFPDGHLGKYRVQRSNRGHGGHPVYFPLTGPPYTTAEIENAWPNGGVGVHDNLCNMAVDGLQFWLCRADGGSVHFVWHSVFGYQATEVFDPHGLKTTLHYNGGGLLDMVTQDGGRYLMISWGRFGASGWQITRVENGGSAGSQFVTYGYTQLGLFPVLATVNYTAGPPAVYTYGFDYGDPNAPSTPSLYPLLKAASDPRYAGAMTQIAYNYSGIACPTPTPAHWGDPPPPSFVLGNPYSITAEKNSRGQMVSSLTRTCLSFVRIETNGLGGQRMFGYGAAGGSLEMIGTEMVYCRGFQLGKVTDFYLGSPGGLPPANVASDLQKFGNAGHPRRLWDGLNHMTQADYQDDSGSPSAILHVVDGTSCTYDRSPATGTPALDSTCMHNPYRHWLFSKTDERNQVTRYTRDARRRVTRIDYPDNSFEEYGYNIYNQVETHRLPSGAMQYYQYDALQRLFRETNSVDINDYREYIYYGPGDHPEWTDLVKTVTNGRSGAYGRFAAQMTYNGRLQVASVEYPPTGGSANPTVLYEYDDYGNCSAIVDELGHRKDYTYDSYRRCTSLTEQVNSCGVGSRRWDWFYDREMDYASGTIMSSYRHTSKEWRLQIEPVFNAANDRRATARRFDVNNRIVLEQTGLVQHSGQPFGTLDQGSDAETHHFAYDANGQKQSYTDPLGRVTTYDYDNRNRLWKTTEYPIVSDSAPPRVTETFYNATGDKTKVTFPDTKTQEWPDYGYTAFGQPRVFINERFQTTNMEYKPWGPMKKLAEVVTHREMGGGGEVQQTTFDYDGIGRLLTTSFPDHISTEVSTYKFGQLETYKTRRGPKKTISYDARGRETGNIWDDGTTSGVNRTWDDANRLMSVSNNISTIGYTYDAVGQMLTESTSIVGSDGTTPLGNAVTKQLSYCRYPSGEVSTVTYPNGSITVGRSYTARGQLKTVDWSGGSTSYVYLVDGKVDYQARSNGVTTTYGYDGRGMINSLRHTSNGHDLARRDYWRDDRDRITAWKRGIGTAYNGMEDGRGNRYHYDDEGELDLADYRAVINTDTGTVTDPKRRDTLNYDALGNRAGGNHVASWGDMNFTRRDNGLNQYLNWTPSAIYYDDNLGPPTWVPPGNGVMMADGWVTASFNALNQPMAIWCPTYGSNFKWFGYDPLGRCVKRWDGPLLGTPPNQYAPPPNSNQATYYYYDGWNLVQEGSNASTAARTYVHGGRVDEIVASQADGLWYHHHYDAGGNCIMLTTTGGGLQEQYDYDAFGFPYFYTPTGGKFTSIPRTRFLFTGREWLSDLRIYDYRARQYQPELGRFLQPDPKEFDAGDYNFYRYCHNDPVNKTDPTGLRTEMAVELRREYDKARLAASKDPQLKAMFDRIEADTKHTVKIVESKAFGRNLDQIKGTNKGNSTFAWNPRAAVAFAGGSQSPASVLVHEVAHADRIVSDPQGSKNDFGATRNAGPFGNMEDRRVILGPEARAANILHEDTRSSAAGVFYPVDSVLGR